MQEIKEQLAGVFPPMVTPFKDERLDLDGLIANVEKMNPSGLRGYFVLGTNGEFKAVASDEQPRVIEAVAKHKAADKVLMVGTGAESTRETINRTKRAADLGAELISILMPHFFTKKMTVDLLADYILEVADASPVPVLLYNNPSVAAGVTIKGELIRRVSSHPNVVGMKDSSKDTYKENIEAAGDDILVLAGSANYFLDALKSGGIGGVLSLADVFPDECVELYRAFNEGRSAEAAERSAKLVDLNHQVSGSYGVAGVKAAMDIVGLRGGDPRRPLKPLTADEKRGLENTLRDRGMIS